MRRTTRMAAVTAIFALAVAGCANNDKDSGDAAGLCPASGDGPKIGVAYDVGGRGDDSFNDLAAKGVADVAEDLGATCTEAEASAAEPESAKQERLRTLADADHDPIIGVGSAYTAAVQVVAAEYPELKFAVVDGFAEGANVTNLVFTPEQGGYLVGMAAGLTTESNKLGFVGGLKHPVIDTFAAGFVAGVESVNADATIEFKYLSDAFDAKAFKNIPGGRTAATALYDGGADIVFQVAGESGNGVFEAADAAEAWAIGVDADQYLGAEEQWKDNILTSSIKRVDLAVATFLKGYVDGTVVAGFDSYDITRDGVGYSTSGDFLSEEIVTQIEDAKAKIISGEIKVPTELP